MESKGMGVKNIMSRYLKYDMWTSQDCGIKKHPQEQMAELGYKVGRCGGSAFFECWVFEVDDYIEPLPKYLSPATEQMLLAM